MDEHYPPTERPRGRQLPSWTASLIALATAIIAALQSYQSGQDTQRAAYEALRRADAEKAARIVELAQGQLELRSWVTELSGRLDERTTNAEKAIRKVVKPKSPPLPPPAPPPPAPPVAMVTPSTPLPSYEELAR